MPEKKKMSEKTDKRYRAKVTVPGIDKPVYISAKTRRELEQKKKDVLDEYVHGVKVQDKPFVDMIIEWFTVVKKPKIKRNSTLNSWRSTINCHVLPCFSDRKLTSAVTRQDLQACLDKLAGFSEPIIVMAHSALKQTCQYAIAEGIILRDPSILLSKPSTSAAKSRDYLTQDQERTLLKEAEASEYGLLIYLLYYTGCRRGEALGLMWKDVNWEKKTIRICRALDATLPKDSPDRLAHQKNKAADRVVPVPDALLTVLRATRGLPDHYVLSNASAPVSATSAVRRWNAMMLDCGYVRKRADNTPKDGIRTRMDVDITPHWLRHHYITSCVMAGLRPEVTMNIVGHSEYQTTLGIYTHLMHNDGWNPTLLSDAIKNEVAERLPAATKFKLFF